MSLAEAVKRELQNTAILHEAVSEYCEGIVKNWQEEGARGGDALEEVRKTMETLLLEAGVLPERWTRIWQMIYDARATDEQISAWEVAEAVVPIENPVQMNLSPISVSMINGANSAKVSLDWLATKRVVASQVDSQKLQKIVSRHRQRAEKRGLKVSSGGVFMSEGGEVRGSAEEEMELISRPAELDAQVVVDELIAGSLSEGGDRPRPIRDLILENFDVSLGGKRILTNANIHFSYGRRYGLVGRNGVGKSTFLRNISSRQLPVPANLSILHVEQEVVGDDTLALQSVLSADFKRAALLCEEARLQTLLGGDASHHQGGDSAFDHKQTTLASERLQAVYRLLHEQDASSAEARASTILHGLGFSSEDQRRATRDFSGGWRMRLALARALFCQPDILLLDEPTNMLDFPSVVWLEGYLNNWEGTLLVVSHDRCFLDNVATDIVHMHSEQLEAYRGNYVQFLATREERQKNQQREYEAQLQYRQHLQAFIDRWRYNANRAPQAQSRLKILEKLPPLRPVITEAQVVLRFPAVEPISPPILQLDEVTFRYPTASSGEDENKEEPCTMAASEPILERINFNVQPGSKIAIVGPNGAGKTTLLKLLAGRLEPTSGMIYRHGRLRIGLFTQHHVDQLNMSLSPLELLQSRFPGKTDEEYRHGLGSFGLSGPLALQTIRTLSGGQKSRVVFTLLTMDRPHIMILDEPTNHLDMDTIDALIKALKEYAGGVLIVSHDKRFIELVADQVWVCNNRRLVRFDGSIYDYARELLSRRANVH